MSSEQSPDPSTRPPQRKRPRTISAEPLMDAVRGQNAYRVISRLQRHGYEAYLVGGCVRDLLVGRTPKDFDVVTDARPRQIRRLFPQNSHIIGKRFRLVHVRYGNDAIVETATFRREPEQRNGGDDLLILEDNVYGTAEEDARRRDFTVNALFLDPTHAKILDYVGGLDDLDARVLRTIGDPRVRILEDPVRILRAIKFATRLDFRIDDDTWRAMSENAGELARSAPPRVLEELLRLLRSGTALGAFRKLRSCGVLRVVLPELDRYLDGERDGEEHERAESFWRLLEALDTDVRRDYEPSTAVCVALLFHDLVDHDVERVAAERPLTVGDPVRIASAILEPIAAETRLPRRDTTLARRIIVQQRNFLRPPSKHWSRLVFAASEEFPEAFEVFRLRTLARGQGRDICEGWEQTRADALALPLDELESERKKTRGRRRRSRRRRRRGSAAE